MSQHLVSWIQVIGLIVGLYGFFFVSISIFGDKNAYWFSALLPASGIGLGSLVALSGFPISPIIYTLGALLIFVFMYFFFVLIRAVQYIRETEDNL